jgi:hypothetical protein
MAANADMGRLLYCQVAQNFRRIGVVETIREGRRYRHNDLGKRLRAKFFGKYTMEQYRFVYNATLAG